LSAKNASGEALSMEASRDFSRTPRRLPPCSDVSDLHKTCMSHFWDTHHTVILHSCDILSWAPVPSSECTSTGLYGAIKADLEQRSSSSTRKTGATCTQLWIEWLPQRVPSKGERLYGECPKNETWRFFLFFSAHWPSAMVR